MKIITIRFDDKGIDLSIDAGNEIPTKSEIIGALTMAKNTFEAGSRVTFVSTRPQADKKGEKLKVIKKK